MVFNYVARDIICKVCRADLLFYIRVLVSNFTTLWLIRVVCRADRDSQIKKEQLKKQYGVFHMVI
jgi:hypothetical protein